MHIRTHREERQHAQGPHGSTSDGVPVLIWGIGYMSPSLSQDLSSINNHLQIKKTVFSKGTFLGKQTTHFLIVFIGSGENKLLLRVNFMPCSRWKTKNKPKGIIGDSLFLCVRTCMSLCLQVFLALFSFCLFCPLWIGSFFNLISFTSF